MSITLSPAEIERLSGGYKRPADQLRELHRQGFYRARRGKVTGEVILERAHVEAVRSGNYTFVPPVSIADIAPSRRKPSRPMDWQARTALYRHFDKLGALLYVGIAVDPKKRESAHRCYSEWKDKIHRVEVAWFDTRHEAVAAERAAIAAERPKFNILHCRKA